MWLKTGIAGLFVLQHSYANCKHQKPDMVHMHSCFVEQIGSRVNPCKRLSHTFITSLQHHSGPVCSSLDLEFGVHISHKAVLIRRVMPVHRFLLLLLPLAELLDLDTPLEADWTDEEDWPEVLAGLVEVPGGGTCTGMG